MGPNLQLPDGLVQLRAAPVSGGFNIALQGCSELGVYTYCQCQEASKSPEGERPVDDCEHLPLFGCATPPQGWSFHVVGNLTSKPTVLECMVKNFKKEFSGAYGVKLSSRKLCIFCMLEWPSFGVG